MYNYEVTNDDGWKVANGRTNSNTADTALMLVSDALPHEAAITDCQRDRQEHGCWSYDCTWDIDTVHQAEFPDSRQTLWTIRIW